MAEGNKTKKNDFVKIEYVGYAEGKVFDSNIEEELKKINPNIKKVQDSDIIIIGQNMVLPSLDKKLEDKEIEKEYEIKISAKDGFGERKKELIKVFPLNEFRMQKIEPAVGMVLTLDNLIAKVIAVNGARVTVDFNNPLAGKDLTYKIKIKEIIENLEEKVKFLLKQFFNEISEYEIKDKEVVVKIKEIPKDENLLFIKKKFLELIGKEIGFELKKN